MYVSDLPRLSRTFVGDFRPLPRNSRRFRPGGDSAFFPDQNICSILMRIRSYAQWNGIRSAVDATISLVLAADAATAVVAAFNATELTLRCADEPRAVRRNALSALAALNGGIAIQAA